MEHHDVIVVGSGQAGVPLAERLARAGRKVLLVERKRFGGTCINTGCTPTKALIATARAAHVARSAGRLGVRVAGEVRVDVAAAIARKNALVASWRDGIEAKLRGTANLSVVHGHARFVAEKTIEVDDTRHTAGVVVLNVGARPSVPRIDGLDGVPWLDNARLLDLRELPRHLVVIGGGYIGCELGQAWRRFGADVTLLDPNAHLMSRLDAAASEAIEGVFRAEGIELALGHAATRARRDGADIVVERDGAAPLRGSHLLVAVGRTPNTDDLGLDAAGVERDARGYIVVDDRYATSAPGVHAVGDCTPGPQFTHASWDDHRLLFDVLAGRPSRRRSERIVPWAVFTDPQIAGVGLSEREARAQGVAFEKASMPWEGIARAAETDEPAGVLQLLVDPAGERILGATLVGAEAGELVHVLVALIAAGASPQALVDMEVVHPTLAEGLQSLVMSLPRWALS